LASLLRVKTGGQSSRQADPLKLKLAGGQTDWRNAMAGGQRSRQADTQKLVDGQAYRLDAIK